MHIRAIVALPVLALAFTPTPACAQSVRASVAVPGLGARALTRLDELPQLRRSVEVGSLSSYDRSGKNDDGFSGAHSFVRKEGDGLVIADLTGPGVVYRIWTPTPTDDPVEFWFDGEATPRLRLPMREIFLGNVDPFRHPLVGFGAGGYYSYVALPYARSLKIVVRGPRVQFYQVNFARYEPSTIVMSFPRGGARAPGDNGAALLARAGGNLASFTAPDVRVFKETVVKTLTPGQRTVLFETRKGGRLAGLRVGPAGALMADRSTLLRIYWDGAAEPAVEAPIADLFGGAWGKPAMSGLLVGTVRDTSYLWFPMPFDHSARVEVYQAPGAQARTLHAEVYHAPVPRRPDEGRFYTTWRRENPTTAGRPFTFLKTTGHGHLVGVILQAQGLGTDGTPFFEGDDRVVIDGDTVVNGTGSEDAFNGGWYDIPGRWDGRRSFPLSGSLGYSNPLARTGGYRFFLGDAYAYRRSIDFTIEHGEDTGNTIPTDHSAVTFFYSADAPTWRSTPFTAEARRAVVPTRVTLNVGWSSSISFFSTRFATITKRPEQGIGRHLSFVGDSTPDFGRHVLSLSVPIPAAGRYRVSILPVVGPGLGSVQLLLDDQPYGRTLDTSAPIRQAGTLSALGELDFDEGDQVLHFKVAPSQEGASRAAFDLIRVVLERVP